jgi:hypothetical protein
MYFCFPCPGFKNEKEKRKYIALSQLLLRMQRIILKIKLIYYSQTDSGLCTFLAYMKK